MARLRLFGPVAEAAGTRTVDVEGATVGECLQVAGSRFGSAFEALLPACRIAVGDRSLAHDQALDHPVGEDDEVVVLPPVGGGAVRPGGPFGLARSVHP